MIKLFIFIFFPIFSVFGDTSILMGHDRIIYNPLDKSSKKIIFDVEIQGLASEITKLKSYGNIKNLSFTVSVFKTNKKEIQINGLKGKFNDLEKNLKTKLIPYLEIIFPSRLVRSYRGYDLKSKGKKVTAIDKSYTKQIKESYMIFDKVGYLIQNKLKTSQGTQIINFSYKQASSGDAKVLLERLERKIIYGPTHLLSDTNVEYSKVSGYFFPKLISTNFIFENKDNNTNGKRVNKLTELYTIKNVKFE